MREGVFFKLGSQPWRHVLAAGLRPLLRTLSRKLPNSVKLRRGYSYYAAQGH